ncbi:tryptophan synthase subunit alpha [Sulfurimonas sp. C5]|uniref:tryptophan synthase subunit alpha n=1 Tax=Sulfurimonas sp. C5 TaxID=3036947 RepID=UPI002455BD58|nr:tryptophan synthase subunit alpha [Sulfurimonas sp. C5]MDH4945066.1 tryptophan synthase subunit alpha [Sulfurimonas sp. C5]
MKDLVAYITSGYPEKNFSIDLALALGENGVDTLELGVPFSDPVADGPAIEKANQKALEQGFKFKDLLEISKEIAPKVDTLWMGYFNSFYQQKMESLLPKAQELGLNGLIIPDLPHEEALAYKDLFAANKLSNISFVAPTDSRERIQEIVTDAQKFIYMVAYTGITGSGVSEDLQPFLASIKEFTQTPVYVGFGVNEKTAKEKVKGADGVIVGSAFINILLNDTLSYTEKINQCALLAKEIKEKINS